MVQDKINGYDIEVAFDKIGMSGDKIANNLDMLRLYNDCLVLHRIQFFGYEKTLEYERQNEKLLPSKNVLPRYNISVDPPAILGEITFNSVEEACQSVLAGILFDINTGKYGDINSHENPITTPATTWDKFYLDMATLVSKKSKDESTQVGAVIVSEDNSVRSIGYNGISRGVNEIPECRHERPTKYMFYEHAERNAVFNAHSNNAPVKDCTLYLNFMPYPCTDCCRALVQTGVKKIVGTNIPFPGKGEQWESMMVASREMLRESGVELVITDYNSEYINNYEPEYGRGK